MKALRQISRRFGRSPGAQTRSAAFDCIAGTVSFGLDPLLAENVKPRTA